MDEIIVKIAGVTFDDAQNNIKQLEMMTVERIDLIREPSNLYDSNAIRVENKGCYLGYIPKQIGKDLAIKMDLGAILHAIFVRVNRSPYHDAVGLTVKIMGMETIPYSLISQMGGFINNVQRI